MKLLLVGSFSQGNLEFSYERALNVLGCKVLRFDLGQVNKILAPWWERIINSRILNSVVTYRPDIILVIKGYYLWPQTIRKIRQSGDALISCFMGDDPFDLATPGMSNRNILDSIPYYDCYFIWTRSFIKSLIASGARMTEELPFGFDSLPHHPLKLSEYQKGLYGNDIVFIGNWDPEREYWLQGLIDFDLGIWGRDYWRRCCQDRQLRKKWRRKALYNEEMSKALNAAKISLNILRKQNKGNHNMRTFEAPACAAFVLSQRSPEQAGFFEEDKEAVYFSSQQELREKARYYLVHDRQRQSIARAGYERCLRSGYSYLDRAKQIIKIISNCDFPGKNRARII